MQIYCLEKALQIVIPILNLYEFSKFNGNYWYITSDRIRTYIHLEQYEKAQPVIDELYKNAIYFYENIENVDNTRERIWKMQFIAESYAESALKEKAVNTYLVVMYIGLEKDNNQYKILKDRDSNLNICKISQVVNCLLDGEVENDIVDKIIDLKDALIRYREDYQGDRIIYDKIISKINDYNQNQEIEFKK